MSVQVSYKKQSLLGIIGLLILFLVIEIIANVWWVTQINCEFEENEIFQTMDNQKKRQLCVDLYEIRTSGMELIPNQQSESITINSLGFRGDEMTAEKPDDAYRIFMLGGSTMFGHGATSDQTTIPGYVQKNFNENFSELQIEVINSGIQGADSFDELELIGSKLLDYSPNLVIIYDGWNDLRERNSVETIVSNWKSMCQIGKERNFDTIIILQPIAGFGNKQLTEQELLYSETGTDYTDLPLINNLEKYEKYAQNLKFLDNCYGTFDFRTVFDQEKTAIYWDQGHVSDDGNKIIAGEIFDKIKDVVKEDARQAVQSYKMNEEKKIQSDFGNQVLYLISGYKTPIMINTIFSFSNSEEKPPEPDNQEDVQKRIFKTNSKIYGTENLFIEIEIFDDADDLQKKIVQIRTINETNDSYFSNVTYFLKIINNDQVILSDFFFSESKILELDVSIDETKSLNITGKRQYDHNALVFDEESEIKISGPLFTNGENYKFIFELRTLNEPSEWIFSLDKLSVEISI